MDCGCWKLCFTEAPPSYLQPLNGKNNRKHRIVDVRWHGSAAPAHRLPPLLSVRWVLLLAAILKRSSIDWLRIKLAYTLPNAFPLLSFFLLTTCSLHRWSTACCLTQRNKRKRDKHLKSWREITKWLYCLDVYTCVHHIFLCNEKASGDNNETATIIIIIIVLKILCGKSCTAQTDWLVFPLCLLVSVRRAKPAYWLSVCVFFSSSLEQCTNVMGPVRRWTPTRRR